MTGLRVCEEGRRYLKHSVNSFLMLICILCCITKEVLQILLKIWIFGHHLFSIYHWQRESIVTSCLYFRMLLKNLISVDTMLFCPAVIVLRKV